MKPIKSALSSVMCSMALLLIPLLSAVAQQSSSESASYEADIQAWHDTRIANLRRPVGWLSLVALDWLKEGKNTLESIGTVTVEKGTLSFEALPGVKAVVRGNVFSSGALRAGEKKFGEH